MEPAPHKSVHYLPGLDGIRALAVLAVVLFHSSLDVLPGGFLGVEMFFVISGFIITSGLLREFGTERRIDLPGFWRRRALRLLPAVALLLVAALAYTELFALDTLASLRNDALASMLYVTNWYLVADGQSYFGGFESPSLLKHLWSLAIEEQFYVVWPPIVLGGLLLMRRRTLGALLLVLAGASAGLMWAMVESGADTSRLYYGTDTRASGLLVGAALALWWAPAQQPAGPLQRVLQAISGGAALAVLGFFCVAVTDSSAGLYRGGFLAVDIATAVLIVAAVSPGTVVARGLGWAPLRWVGLRSFGLYLWHWPIILIVTPGWAWSGGGYAEFALQAGLTAIIAATSYRWLELPIRRQGFRGTFDALRRRVQLPFVLRLGRAAGAAGAMCSLGVIVAVAATARPPQEPDYFKLESIRVVSAARSEPTPNSEVSGVSFEATDGIGGAELDLTEDLAQLSKAMRGELAPTDALQGDAGALAAEQDQAAAPAAPTPGPALDIRVTAVGDSVMLGAANQLAAAIGGIDVDAMVSRSMDAAIGVLESRSASGTLASVVLLHIGNNGPIHDEQIDRIAALVGTDRHVLLLSLRVPRNWEEGNNDVLARAVERYPNFELLDWRSASADRSDILWKDGIHLRPEGAVFYAALVQAAIAGD